ncbi:MAG: 50S ribosomal protein L24 [Thermoplasmata archaeon]|nr:50S ribosomal protein L24 [Thermoplasmata archaeon]
MSTTSHLPRRQRKALYTADLFERRRRMAVPLSKELRRRYGRRQLPVRKGDTVRVLSGSYVGREERVAKVNLRNYSVTLDNVTGKTADAKLKPLPVRPNHLVLTKLNLADPWRRRVLKVPDAEAPSEEETPEAPSSTSESPTAATKEDDA